MYKPRLRITLKCPRHPRYDPSKHGEGAIRGGCRDCSWIWALYRVVEEVQVRLENANAEILSHRTRE